MRNFEFIHAAEDVPKVLRFASELGLIIRQDHPTKTPKPDIVSDDVIDDITKGIFFLYRKDWIFGDLKFDIIEDGSNKGLFFQNSATNYVAVSLYFGGEIIEKSIARLGGGNLSRDIDWYQPSDHSVHLAPTEVKDTFDKIRKYMDTRKRLRGGVHNYAILENAWNKLLNASALPPYDYIGPPIIEAGELSQ